MTEKPKPFIDPDEHIIVFDMPSGALSVDDLKRLVDIGVRTMWANVLWHYIEPRFGQYDWGILDPIVERALRSGMKLGLTTPASGLVCAPEDWYLRMPDGKVWRDFYDGYHEGGFWAYSELSPWCAEAMAYERDFVKRVRARYPMETVQLVNGNVHGGEQVLPGMVESWFDDHALNSFREYARDLHHDSLVSFNRQNHTYFRAWDEVQPALFPNRGAMQYRPTTTHWLRHSLMEVSTSRQALFASQPWKETWLYLPQRENEYSEAAETSPRSCNWLAEEMYEELPFLLETSLNIILFEVFRPSGTQTVLDAVRGYESVTWVGSQYTQGIQHHTHSVVNRGLRGFLTAPLHFEQGSRTLEPWMLETMAWSLRQFEARASQEVTP